MTRRKPDLVLRHDGDLPPPSEWMLEHGDPSKIQYSPTGGMKDNRDKPPVDFLSSKALIAIAEAVGFGARKYEPHNWRRGNSWSQTLGSIERHLLAWNDGEDVDPETGLTHLAHAGAQLMFLIEYTLTGVGVDDRYTTQQEVTDGAQDRQPDERVRRRP